MLIWLANKVAEGIEGEALGMEALRVLERDLKR